MYNLIVVTSGEEQTGIQPEIEEQTPPPELVSFIAEHFQSAEPLDCGCCSSDISLRSGHLTLELPNSDERAIIELSKIFIVPREQHLMLSPDGQTDGTYQDSVYVMYVALGLNGSRPPEVYVIGNWLDLDGVIWRVGPLEG